MKVLHSVRTRIIMISSFLLVLFLVVYTITVWTVANTYALVTTSQSNSFSLSLVSSEISSNLDAVRALVTRVSIDNELKNEMVYSDESRLNDYFESFDSMIKSSPAYSIIDRFIVTDSSFSDFIQTGGAAIPSGRPLRQDYLLQEMSHIDREKGYSSVFYSDLSYRDYPVIAFSLPVIDYNSHLTIGYVYASVSIDALLDSLYNYQQLNEAEIYISFSNSTYKVDDGMLHSGTASLNPVQSTTILTNETSSVYKDESGKYILNISDEENSLEINLLFSAPGIFGTTSSVPLLMLGLSIGLVVLLIAVVLYIYLNGAIYKPVKKLSKRIEKIQESDFSQDDTINTEDEFGIIGRGINKLSSEVTNLMDRRVEDERKKIELEYKMLQNQINPHFLYNTFNSIKWMAQLQGADGISEMITSLSRIMKNISKRDTALVTIAEELSFIDDYLVIMKYRYGNTISYYRHVDESCLDIMIPRFTLQPLVENAIFHGIEPKGTGAIAIIVRDFPGTCAIMVADNGQGFDTRNEQPKGDGVFKNIGLGNIRQRLAYTFHDRADFTITSRPGYGTQCIIHIRRGTEDGLQGDNC